MTERPEGYGSDHPSFDEFEKLFNEFVEAERDIVETKGREYAMPGQHKLANFKRVTDDLKHLNLDVVDVIWVYMRKHIDSVVTFLQTRHEASEPIERRIYDLRVYLLLLAYAIQLEREDEEFINDGLNEPFCQTILSKSLFELNEMPNFPTFKPPKIEPL